MIKKLIKYVLGIFFYIFRIFPINNKKICVVNFNGKGYGDNIKPIIEELIIQNKQDEFDIVWLVAKKYDDIPKFIKQVKIKSLSAIYHLSTSKIWVNNHRFNTYVKKRKNQFYIQTWHSSLRLKKIEGDAINYLPPSYVEIAKHDSKMINLLTCGSLFSKKTYETSFWYDGEILLCGTPKFDIYFKDELKRNIKEKLLKKYNINSKKKIILYAPTFRKDDDKFSGNLDFSFLKNDNDFENYVFLIRLHPNSKALLQLSEEVINVTDYSSIEELLIACDMLITDYSGCCFDALVLKKPCILYVPDLKEYLLKERNLYFDFEELPFEKCSDLTSLKKKIHNFNYSKYLDKINGFSKKIGLLEKGKASKMICERIEKEIYEKI